MSHTSSKVNPHSRVCLNIKELLAQSRHHIWSLSDRDIHEHWILNKAYISYVKFNLAMKDIFVEELFVLINPAWDLSPVHVVIDLEDLDKID